MIVRKTLQVLALILVIMAGGCIKIPPEAPELSAQLGTRLSSIEVSNLILLHRFFDHKRNEIDKFIEEEWVPIFAEEFFSNSTIEAAWETLVSENNKRDRLQFIVEIGPRLQGSINTKRLELIQPLDGLERGIEEKIRSEYAQARAMNNSITSFLLSASKVAETRDRYLEMVGVTDEQIGKLIDQTDDAVSDLLKKTGDAQRATDNFLGKIRSIRDTVRDTITQ